MAWHGQDRVGSLGDWHGFGKESSGKDGKGSLMDWRGEDWEGMQWEAVDWIPQG